MIAVSLIKSGSLNDLAYFHYVTFLCYAMPPGMNYVICLPQFYVWLCTVDVLQYLLTILKIFICMNSDNLICYAKVSTIHTPLALNSLDRRIQVDGTDTRQQVIFTGK